METRCDAHTIVLLNNHRYHAHIKINKYICVFLKNLTNIRTCQRAPLAQRRRETQHFVPLGIRCFAPPTRSETRFVRIILKMILCHFAVILLLLSLVSKPVYNILLHAQG